MRKIILGLAVSLDGYIEGPNGEYDWCFTDQDYGLAAFYQRVDTTFMGRRTYEMMRAMGTEATAGMPRMQEYIFSTTLDKVEDGAILVKGDIQKEIEKIKGEKGKDIWLFGGASLTASLLELGLIDEFWLSVHPIILGSGKPLFSGLKDRTYLELMETKTYNTGLVSLKYTLANRP